MNNDPMGKWLTLNNYDFEVFPINECPTLSNCVYVFISRKVASESLRLISYGSTSLAETQELIPTIKYKYPVTHVCIYNADSKEDREKILDSIRNNELFRWLS